MKRTRKVSTAKTMSRKGSYVIFSPSHKRYVVDNLSAFARRFGLDRSAISRVARGQRKMHKNWTGK